MKEKEEEIKKDILDLYEKLMKHQEKIKSANLANGGNLGAIISAYITARYSNKCNCNNRHSLY